MTAAVAALGLWCSIPDTAPLATENPTSTAFIDLRRDAAEDASKPFQLRWQWRRLGAISRYLRAAVIYAEDYNFYRHGGVDWDAIEHAVTTDLTRSSMAIGGSTITQQLAKNLYLSPSRSPIRKARELLIAHSLEDHLSKQRILELYLNVVEWGDGVFGAEAASRTWFHHAAQQLSPAEAIRLAIALPNPYKRAPNVRSPELTAKAVRLAHLLRMQGLINAAQERATLDELGAPGEKTLPERAPGAPAQLPPEPPIDGTPEKPRADTAAPTHEPSLSGEPVTTPEPPAAEPSPPSAPAPSTPPPAAEPPPADPPRTEP